MIPVIMLESIKQIYLFSIIEHFLPDQLHYTDYVDEKKHLLFQEGYLKSLSHDRFQNHDK